MGFEVIGIQQWHQFTDEATYKCVQKLTKFFEYYYYVGDYEGEKSWTREKEENIFEFTVIFS